MDEILNLIESVSEGFPSYSLTFHTRKEVCRKIEATIGDYDEHLTLVRKQKLRWFGHVSRSFGLAKTVLRGTVKGKRRRGGKTILKTGQE